MQVIGYRSGAYLLGTLPKYEQHGVYDITFATSIRTDYCGKTLQDTKIEKNASWDQNNIEGIFAM